MQRLARYSLPAVVVLAMSFVALSVGSRLVQRAVMQRRLNNWDIAELTDHLNRAGLNVRLCSTLKNGVIGHFAYLTTTDETWEDLSRLRTEDSRHIQQWRGTVYCERTNKDWELMFDHRDEHYLVAGPFVFYGDIELLERIRAIVLPSESP